MMREIKDRYSNPNPNHNPVPNPNWIWWEKSRLLMTCSPHLLDILHKPNSNWQEKEDLMRLLHEKENELLDVRNGKVEAQRESRRLRDDLEVSFDDFLSLRASNIFYVAVLDGSNSHSFWNSIIIWFTQEIWCVNQMTLHVFIIAFRRLRTAIASKCKSYKMRYQIWLNLFKISILNLTKPGWFHICSLCAGMQDYNLFSAPLWHACVYFKSDPSILLLQEPDPDLQRNKDRIFELEGEIKMLQLENDELRSWLCRQADESVKVLPSQILDIRGPGIS